MRWSMQGTDPGTAKHHIHCLCQYLGKTQSHLPVKRSANGSNSEHLPCVLAKAPPPSAGGTKMTEEMGQTRLTLRSQTWPSRQIYMCRKYLCAGLSQKITVSHRPHFTESPSRLTPTRGRKYLCLPAAKPQQARGRNCTISFLWYHHSCVPDTVFFLKIIIISTWKEQKRYALPVNNDLGHQEKNPKNVHVKWHGCETISHLLSVFVAPHFSGFPEKFIHI